MNLGWVRRDSTNNESATEKGNIILYVGQNIQAVPALKACPKLQWSLNVKLIGSQVEARAQL